MDVYKITDVNNLADLEMYALVDSMWRIALTALEKLECSAGGSVKLIRNDKRSKSELQ